MLFWFILRSFPVHRFLNGEDYINSNRAGVLLKYFVQFTQQVIVLMF